MWEFEDIGLPAVVKENFKDYRNANPVPGNIKASREKVEDQIEQVGKNYASGVEMHLVASGDATQVHISITPV